MGAASRPEDARLAAIGAAAAGVFRARDYHLARTEDIAAAVSVDGGDQDGRSRRGRRSAVWVYTEVKSRRVLVALALHHAWAEYQERSSDHPVAERCETLNDARAQVAAALMEVVRFHRAEARLVERVGFGIGDISTAEKRRGTNTEKPVWPPTVLGTVAEEGFAARIGAFTAYLAPFLRAALESVVSPTDGDVERSARSLSNLVFRACLADPDGPVDRTVEALAAFWFERDLVRLAGAWVLDLDGAERSLSATARRTDPRAEGYARAALIRVLLDAGTLHRRGAGEGRTLTGAFAELTGWPRPNADTADLVALCDAAARQALSLRGFGDLAAAHEADELSLRVALDGVGDTSLAARARTNLGETLSRTGAAGAAMELLAAARADRAALLAGAADGQGRDTAWRRLCLTDQAITAAHIRAGRVTAGLRCADTVLAEIRARAALPPELPVGAHLLHAEALLAAGHPGVARESALVVYHDPHTQKARSGLRHATVILLLARIARAAGRPETAVRLLADDPVLTPWFAERVSVRTGADARRVLGGALAECGGADRGLDQLTAAAAMLPGPADDPLAVLVEIESATALLAHGTADDARARIDAVLKREELPGTLRAKALLTRDRIGGGDDGAGDEALHGALTLDDLDPVHPLLLTARVDLAERSVGRGDLPAAMELLDPFVGAPTMAHGRTLLGVDHPLLRRAIAVLDRIGVAHGWGPLPEPLSLD